MMLDLFYIYWLTHELIKGLFMVVFYNFDEHFAGEKLWNIYLDKNSPYFALAANRDRTCDSPLAVEF